MSKPVRILGIAGSLRRDSYNRATLRAAFELAPEGALIATKEFIRQLLQNLVDWTRRIS